MIFKTVHGVYQTADEFLSGNVREKLRLYKTFADDAEPSGSLRQAYLDNVTALEAVQPKELEAGEINARLGATWIDQRYVQQFMYETLNTSRYNQSIYQVRFTGYSCEWQVVGKGKDPQFSDIAATVTYGTKCANAYEILEETLNLRDVRIYDYKEDADGIERRVLNKRETMLAQQKQEALKQAFRDWLWKDPERRQTLTELYNERFNSERPREYDGSHLTLPGMSPEIELKPHQKNAVARILYGGNALLAHVVGAGKTFTMTAAAMEMKRLGLANKSMFAVPNYLTEQWAAEILRLYPAANILVATKRDFEMRNRKKFCAKIATGDYDAVIIGHTQLEKIPMSRERQEKLLRDQISDVVMGIREIKLSEGSRVSVKGLERTRKSLEAKLSKLLNSKKRDDVVTYEQLGVDRLFVDEAHNFKNLYHYTKMRNVVGVAQTEAQKSTDLFMKCRYMDELTGGKGTIFATGTPISNTMAEMYTMQRYLQYENLEAKGLSHFDSWASIFGETTTSLEIAPEGNIWCSRLFLGDADGFGIVYYQDVDSLVYWANEAAYRWKLRGFALWSLGQEDLRLWAALPKQI